jgi:hypothetical protein
MSTLAEDLRTLAFKKRAAGQTMKVAKAIAADMKSWEMQCYDRIDEELGTDENGGASLRNKHGTFVAGQTIYAHIVDREAFEAWAKEQDETYFDEKPREQILNQLARELLDNGEDFPPGLSAYPRRKVTVKGGERA